MAEEIVEDMETTQYFTDEAVTEEDLAWIVKAGINTPSAMNSQPWHFSVVTDASVLQQIADEMSFGSTGAQKAGIADAPAAIIVSAEEGSELDAGLATQTMSVMAQLLGYGSKIISSPTIVLNGDNKADYQELLGIPEDMEVKAILLIGYEDTSVDTTMDGYTGATERNAEEDMVSWVK